MFVPTPLQQRLLSIIGEKGSLRSSEVHAEIVGTDNRASLVTVKRSLSALAKEGFLSVTGASRSVTYALVTRGRVFLPVNARDYCINDPDERRGLNRFNFRLLPEMPTELFSKAEMDTLCRATKAFQKRKRIVTPMIAKKELLRLIIELSWKSSKIEGNTYTLLDTEKLLQEHHEAAGHRKDEAQMILNHREAFLLIHAHARDFRTITRANLDHVHSLLTRGLKVGRGLRSSPVGITGSRYCPLDNIHQITDALQALALSVRRMRSPFDKSLLALLGISYIQPFEDGNKRTARLMADALLLAYGCAPLSFRSVKEDDYRDATIAFYELNSIVPLKKIFIEQYVFAAGNYAVR